MKSLNYYLPGALLVLLAIVIIAAPEILIALAASLLFMAGMGALLIGHRLRRNQLRFTHTRHWRPDDGRRHRPAAAEPIFRFWFREF
jgi:hypothetical protein